MSTGDRNSLNVLGEHYKDITVGQTTPMIMEVLCDYLRELPSLDFSEKEHATICNHFRVNADELADAMAALQARSGQPTPALLRTIGAAVYRANKTNKGGRTC